MVFLKILGITILSLLLLVVLAVEITKIWAKRKYGKTRGKSIGHWLNIAVYTGLFSQATQWLMFWPAWLFRKKGWFSWWLDAETEGFADYEQFIGDKWTIWKEYNWNLRNAGWTFRRKWKVPVIPFPDGKPGNNNIYLDELILDTLYKKIPDPDNPGVYLTIPQEQLSRWIATAGLKYVRAKESDDPYQQNKGNIIDWKYSIFGFGMYWFYPGEDPSQYPVMFRYSECELVEYKILGIRLWRGYRNVKLGYFAPSYVMTVKHQKAKPLGTF